MTVQTFWLTWGAIVAPQGTSFACFDSIHQMFNSTTMSFSTPAFLECNLSIYSGQWGPAHAHKSHQKHDHIILSLLAGIAIRGSLTFSATAMGIGQQLRAQLAGDHHTNLNRHAARPNRLFGCNHPPKLQSFRSSGSPAWRHLDYSGRRLLLLCQQVRHNKRKFMSTVCLKEKVQNTMGRSFWWEISGLSLLMDESSAQTSNGPLDSPPFRPLCDPHSNSHFDWTLWGHTLPTPFKSYLPLLAP